MERPATISFKLNCPKKTIKSALFVGDPHVAKMEKKARQRCSFDFVCIGGAQAHEWKINFGNIFQRSKAEILVIQMGGNDVSQHPKKFVSDNLAVGQTAQHLCALMRFCRQEGKKAYGVKVASRQNCSLHAEAISILNKSLKDQKKNNFVTHDVDSDNNFSSNQVHLTKAGYAELLSVVDNLLATYFTFDVLYFCLLIKIVFCLGHNSDPE